MMKHDVIALDGKKAGSVDLSEDVFGLEPRADLIHRVVLWQLAKRQAGTHEAKKRADIARTGKKFGRQKGGGSARHGSRRSGIFVGGGKSHSPVTRSHAHDLPKKIRLLGLKHALSAKAKSDSIVVVDDAVSADGKTRTLLGQFGKLGFDSALIIGGREIDSKFRLAARSIPNVDVLPIQGINVYDVMRRGKLVLTKAALEELEARFK